VDQLTEAVYLLHAQILKTLANPRRLMIMDCLHSGEKSVGELEAALDLPQANVSQHLAILRGQGLVTSRREGNTICYSLVSEKVVEACDLFHEFLVERMQSNQALADNFPQMRPLLGDNDSTPPEAERSPGTRGLLIGLSGGQPKN
jgi:ArsR family transcriptional regulator, virulence genes transcriptional regulator